ncbi:MAG TPA: methyltransferase domain-containing protein [Candidatus Paceibacterota bacterium]|nr:methyltransferase domain-containing protein [Candidatus Paceibacterota bacterium]
MSELITLASFQNGIFNPQMVVDLLGIQEGMRIADFGSGSGHFSLLFAEKVGSAGQVSAIDVQEAPLDIVRSRAKEAGLTNLETIRADLEILGSSGLPDNSQDVVLVANILFQSQKKSEIIREAKRILKDSGRLVIIEWAKGMGGFGPPDDLRTDDAALQTLVTNEGFNFEQSLKAGQFHFVLFFHK